jgi:glycosyltransferase involved in cell wall biosynthesis
LNSSPRIALFSPNKEAYSESFIQRHKNLLNGKNFYFYGGFLPHSHEPTGNILGNDWFRSLLINFGRGFLNREQYDREYQIKRKLRKLKANIILAEYGPTAVHSLKICKELRLPLIVHFHGFDASYKETLSKYKAAYKKVFEYASAIICVSDPMKKKLLALGCPEKKLHKVRYCPDSKFFNIKPNYSNKNLLSISRFVDKKAPYYLILAFKKVLEKHPNSKLVIAGEGPLLEVTQNLASFYGINAKVNLLGKSSRDTIIEHMQNSCAYIQHSITSISGDQEGSPVSIIEALAAGLPVISTRHAGIPEIVKCKKTGYLVDEHDVTGMADKIISLLENAHKIQTLGKNAKEMASANFSSNNDIKVIDKLVLQALSS